MKIFKILPFLLIAISAISCNKSDDDRLPQDQYDLRFQKCIQINDSDYSLCFDKIDDSRCPKDMECFWSGVANVGLTLKSINDESFFTLHTLNSSRKDTLIDGLKIELIDVLPYPEANRNYAESDYHVIVKVVEE